jgi:uncharacterized damage-inducible protein DinB
MQVISLAVLLLAATPAGRAQAPASANPVSQSVRSAWDSAKRNIKESADQMPEDGYAFKPVDTVRTFGQILAHVAGVNYIYCGAAKGDRMPRSEDEIEKAATTKAEIVKALDASLAYCDAAFTSLTDASAGESIDLPFGMGRGARAMPLMLNTTHLNEHYGNLVTYFRIKGMVPPSSKRGM